MLAYLDSLHSAVDPDKFEFDPPPFTKTLQDPDCAPGNDGLVILELGSGTGLVAARVAPYLREGRDIMVATDLPEVCELLKKNLLDHPAVEVHPLSWGNHQEGLDIASKLGLGSTCRLTHIICSDLVRCAFCHCTCQFRTKLQFEGVLPLSPGPVVTHAFAYHIRTHRHHRGRAAHSPYFIQDPQSREGDAILDRLWVVVQFRARNCQTQDVVGPCPWLRRAAMGTLRPCRGTRRLAHVRCSEATRVEDLEHSGD